MWLVGVSGGLLCQGGDLVDVFLFIVVIGI